MDRELTQHQVAKLIGVNKNFIYELELNKRKTIIFALHKEYSFLGYIPKVLMKLLFYENYLFTKLKITLRH